MSRLHLALRLVPPALPIQRLQLMLNPSIVPRPHPALSLTPPTLLMRRKRRLEARNKPGCRKDRDVTDRALNSRRSRAPKIDSLTIGASLFRGLAPFV